jgi:flagellar biosynthesis/type III secretory pathway protein FliH
VSARAPAEDAARVRESARREGVARGREEGRAAALAEWSPRLAALAAALEQVTANVAAERARLAAEIAETVPAVAVRLARKVVERDLAGGEDAVRRALDPVLRRLAQSAVTAVRLAPDVAQALEAWRRDAGALANVAIHADGALGRGDWIIETDAGFLDGRLATQLDEAARILTEPDA